MSSIKWNTKNDYCSLYKIIGFGSRDNFSISYSNKYGLIAWLAGSYVILYDISTDTQVSFIKNPNNKIISCISFNDSGTLLVTGEAKSKNCEIRIYEIDYNSDKNEYIINCKFINNNHLHGIDKIFFIKNDLYLLCIGGNKDNFINIIDINKNKIIYYTKSDKAILGCDAGDNYMVICGKEYVKFYDYQNLLSDYDEKDINKQVIEKEIIFDELKDKDLLINKIFISAKINKNKDKYMYLFTLDCYLFKIKYEKFKVKKKTNFDASFGVELNFVNNFIGCGASDGVYKIFDSNLSLIYDIKQPPPLGKINSGEEKSATEEQKKDNFFADVIASVYDIIHKKLVIFYSDKTFFSYDISDDGENYSFFNSKVFHSGGIVSMDYYFEEKNGVFKLITCGDDNTLFLWNMKINDYLYIKRGENITHQHIFYSNNIQHIFYIDKNTLTNKNWQYFKINKDDIITNTNSICNYSIKMNSKGGNDYCLTAVKFSIGNNALFLGDNEGGVSEIELENYKNFVKIKLHKDKINAIDTIAYESKKYIVTGSSDSLIYLIDITNRLKELTSENKKYYQYHNFSSPVINVLFYIDNNNFLKLIASENLIISFFEINNGKLKKINSFSEDKFPIYNLALIDNSKKIISSYKSQIKIWNCNDNKEIDKFELKKKDNQKLLDNFRVISDSSGSILSVSNNDKNIRIISLNSYKILFMIQICESITSMKFILYDNYLIASSVEGYIYFFKLNVNNIYNFDIKFNFFEKLIEKDAKLKDNDKLEDLLQNCRNEGKLKINHLELLEQIISESEKSNIISTKSQTEKVDNNDDDEKVNNDEMMMNKSMIFEKKLKTITKKNNTNPEKFGIDSNINLDTYEQNKNEKKFTNILTQNNKEKNDKIDINKFMNDIKNIKQKIKNNLINDKDLTNFYGYINKFLDKIKKKLGKNKSKDSLENIIIKFNKIVYDEIKKREEENIYQEKYEQPNLQIMKLPSNYIERCKKETNL